MASLQNGEDISVDMLYDPETNIKYGTYFLSILYEEFGSWDTVYAAYNAGRSRVNSWLSDDEVTKDGKLVNIPYPETARYVKRVSGNVTEYETARKIRYIKYIGKENDSYCEYF